MGPTRVLGVGLTPPFLHPAGRRSAGPGYASDQAAIYLDESVRGQTGWILPFVSRAWRYVKSTYGNDFGQDGRLYAVFHQDHYSGGRPATPLYARIQLTGEPPQVAPSPPEEAGGDETGKQA
jgi:hypothetical protein